MVDELRGDDFVPNGAGDPHAAMSGFLLNLQLGHNDVSRWTESEWREVLGEVIGIEDEYMADALESVASWGVVDDTAWEPEEGFGEKG
jgi:hypothetical protein